MRISELLLDLVSFRGDERILEIYEDIPLLRTAALKRVESYICEPVENYQVTNDNYEDCITVGFFSRAYSLSLISKYLSTSSERKYIIFCENKYNFHGICNWIEGIDGGNNSEIGFSDLKKLGERETVQLYSVFHSFSDPVYLSSVYDHDFSKYLLSRSGRVGNKRNIRKCLSVLFELIFIKKVKIKSLYPGYVLVSG